MKIFNISFKAIKPILSLLLVVAAQFGFAQYDVEVKTTTTVFVTGGTTVAFKGNNWVSASDIQGSGPVIFNSTAAQNVNMKNNSLSGITVNNGNNVTMLDSMTVANTTLFSIGNLLVGNYRIDQKGKVEGQGSTGRFQGNGNSILSFSGSGGNDSIFLDQTSPNTTNRIKDLRVNRTGATVVCGDTIQVRGVVYHYDGTIQANGSRLKLKALSPSEYGQVSGVGSGTITGTMYMEMQVGSTVASPLEQWRHFTSPLKDATLTNELNDDITIFYTPIQNANVWDFDQTRLVNSWRPIQADEAMHNNHYAIYLWPLSYGLQPAAASFMIDINGTYPGTGNFNHTLGRDNPNSYVGQGYDDTVGWHMIANPYPSNISLPYQADIEGGSAYYVWDITGIWDDSSDCGGCKKRGVYSMYRADNGLTANGGRSVLPPFHVFYVRAATNNTPLALGNSWRTTDSMYNFIGRKSDIVYDKLHIVAKSPEKVTDEIYVWFDDFRGENKYDILDAPKKMNDPYAPNIYTQTEDAKNVAFNVLREIPKDKDFYTVEMPFECKLPGDFELKFDFENQYQVEDVQLEDRKTGKLYDVLRNKTYNFTHDTTFQGQMKNRFVLHFKKTGSTTNIQDYLSTQQPIKITTDTRNIFVRFPILKEGGAQIKVYDMLGRQVMKTRNVDTESEIYIMSGDGLSAGYYTVRVETANEVKSAPVFLSSGQ